MRKRFLAAALSLLLSACAKPPQLPQQRQGKIPEGLIKAAEITLQYDGIAHNVPLFMSADANKSGEELMVKTVRNDTAEIRVIVDNAEQGLGRDTESLTERGSTVRWVTALQAAARLMADPQTGKPYSQAPALTNVYDRKNIEGLWNGVTVACISETDSGGHLTSVRCGRPTAYKDVSPTALDQ